MEFKATERWWQSTSHRKVTGARGHRFMSMKGHAAFGVVVIGALQFLMRVDDATIYRAPPPPVEAPAPLPKSLSYTLTTESPYLRSLEVERETPSHIPQKRSIDFQQLREGKKFGSHQAYHTQTPTRGSDVDTPRPS